MHCCSLSVRYDLNQFNSMPMVPKIFIIHLGYQDVMMINGLKRFLDIQDCYIPRLSLN